MLTLGDSGGALASLGERLTLTGPVAAAGRRGRRGGGVVHVLSGNDAPAEARGARRGCDVGL